MLSGLTPRGETAGRSSKAETRCAWLIRVLRSLSENSPVSDRTMMPDSRPCSTLSRSARCRPKQIRRVAQKANAGATEAEASVTLVDLGGARRSRTRGYVTYRLQNGTWARELSETPTQPLNGFTVAGYEDEDELESLCRAWETADTEGRRLIRLVAELSARAVKKS